MQLIQNEKAINSALFKSVEVLLTDNSVKNDRRRVLFPIIVKILFAKQVIVSI